MSRFGTWVAPRHVEQAVIDHCVRFGTDYVAEAERQFGIPPQSIPVPQAGQFTTVRRIFEKDPEDQGPAVLVINPGLAGQPRREADRTLTAPLALGLGFAVNIGGFEGAGAEVAQILATAYKHVMLQLPPAGLDVESIYLVDEKYDDIPRGAERSLGTARLVFVLWIKNWAALAGGPVGRVPSPDPYDPPEELPRVETVFTQINLGSIEGGPNP